MWLKKNWFAFSTVAKASTFKSHIDVVYTNLASVSDTVNSLMFAGINVCVFEAKPCSWGLIFAVSSGPVSI